MKLVLERFYDSFQNYFAFGACDFVLVDLEIFENWSLETGITLQKILNVQFSVIRCDSYSPKLCDDQLRDVSSPNASAE
jgi:hypothetical protein